MANKTSENFTKLMIDFEGEILHGYICPAGVLTVGVGHAVLKGEPYRLNKPITQAESRRLLASDAEKAVSSVNSLVKVPLNQNRFDALVSFVFNCGRANFAKSTLLKKLNAKDYAGAGGEFSKWIYGDGKKLKGLVRRRAAEKAFV